jgi:hypothetical protein
LATGWRAVHGLPTGGFQLNILSTQAENVGRDGSAISQGQIIFFQFVHFQVSR